MKQDPLIELVSFVFLRTPTDSVDVPENQLSLIPFPIDDIFLEELKNFDVVIFDDFSHRAYFNPVYLDKVRISSAMAARWQCSAARALSTAAVMRTAA